MFITLFYFTYSKDEKSRNSCVLFIYITHPNVYNGFEIKAGSKNKRNH